VQKVSASTPNPWWLELGIFPKGGCGPEFVRESAKLQVKRAYVFYPPCADPGVTLEETLAGINDAYEADCLNASDCLISHQRRWSVCIDLQRPQDTPATVYQGNYSPVTRKPERSLSDLEKVGISF